MARSAERLARRLALAGIAALVTLPAMASPAAASPAGPGGKAAQMRSCGRHLPVDFSVVSRFPRLYSSQYSKRVPVQVTDTGGAPIKDWRMQLYTFGGNKIGQSARDSRIEGTEKHAVRMRFPMQPGKLTLVIKGEFADCGERELDTVVHFVGCRSRLPLKLHDPPGGFAADYHNYLSVEAGSRDGSLIRDVSSRLYDFKGRLFGRSQTVKALFGFVSFDNKLKRTLKPGKYAVVFSGRIDQPKSCGPKTYTKTLTFK